MNLMGGSAHRILCLLNPSGGLALEDVRPAREHLPQMGVFRRADDETIPIEGDGDPEAVSPAVVRREALNLDPAAEPSLEDVRSPFDSARIRARRSDDGDVPLYADGGS